MIKHYYWVCLPVANVLMKQFAVAAEFISPKKSAEQTQLLASKNLKDSIRSVSSPFKSSCRHTRSHQNLEIGEAFCSAVDLSR